MFLPPTPAFQLRDELEFMVGTEVELSAPGAIIFNPRPGYVSVLYSEELA